jgi:hypothetical protein
VTLTVTRSAVLAELDPTGDPILFPCHVETHVGPGLPGFDVVGWPSGWVRETRDRVRAAVLTSGYTWPQTRITVAVPVDVLGPAVRDRSTLDLAIVHGVLAASGQIEPEAGAVLVGTLGLDGRVVGPLDPAGYADALLDVFDDAPFVQWGPHRVDRHPTLTAIFKES